MKRSLLLVVATAMVAASPAIAADFTFDVPLRLTNMPGVTSVTVRCLVSRVAAGADGYAATENVIGRNAASVPISGGSYDGTVTVAVDNSSIHPSSEARSYMCYMSGELVDSTGRHFSLNFGDFNRTYETVTGIRLDRYSNEAAGALP